MWGEARGEAVVAGTFLARRERSQRPWHQRGDLRAALTMRPNATARLRTNSPTPQQQLPPCLPPYRLHLPSSAPANKSVDARNIIHAPPPCSEQYPHPSPHYHAQFPHHGCQRTAGLRPCAGGAQHHVIAGGSRAERAGTSVSGAVPEVGT